MLLRCTTRDCAQNGVCIYGNSTMEGSEEMYLSRSESPVVKGCFIERNNRHGVLIRDGAVPEIAANTIMNNAGYGLVLQNCGGSYKSNVVEKNSKGAVAYWMTDIGDGKADNIGELFARSNSMLGGTVMETRVTS